MYIKMTKHLCDTILAPNFLGPNSIKYFIQFFKPNFPLGTKVYIDKI
jgi:hypothetical protein